MKKARGAIAFVVVCHRSAKSFLHWQTRLHTIQSLDFRFFIHTQHHSLDLGHRPCRPVRRVLRRGMQSYFHNFKDFLDIEFPRTGTMEESASCLPDRSIRSITVRSDLPEDVIGISSTTTMRLGTA
jgi:hypothetical protein